MKQLHIFFQHRGRLTSPMNRVRLLTLAGLAVIGTIVFSRLKEETGSAAFALAGASMVLILALLPLRCQLDPCHR